MSEWFNNRYDDGMWWGDAFDSREEAIENGISQYRKALKGIGTELFEDDCPNSVQPFFYIGEAVNFSYVVDADMVIEDVVDQAYEQCGEAADGFLDFNSITSEQVKELQKSLQSAFDNWLKEYNLTPTFYAIDNVEEIDVKDYIQEI